MGRMARHEFDCTSSWCGRILAASLIAILATLQGVESASTNLKVGATFTFYYDYNYLVSIMMAHLDLMKHFNSTLREKYGDPILPIDNIHPNMSTLEVITRECVANAVYCTAAAQELILEHDVNAMAGDYVTAPCETAGALAAANAVPHVSLCLGTTLSDRTFYPYTFRGAIPNEIVYDFMWQYMNYFNFRTAILLYTNDGYSTSINNIKDAAQSEGRGDAVQSIPLLGSTWSDETLENVAAKIKALPIRLLLLGYRSDLANNMHTFLLTYSLHRPKYQIVTTGTNRYSQIHTSAFIGWHETVGRLSSTDGTLDKWHAMRAKMTQSDIIELGASYGTSGWSPVGFYSSRLPSDSDLQDPDSLSESMGLFVILTFSVMHTTFVGMNELLNEGYDISDIRGSLLKDKIQSLNVTGIGKQMYFDDNQDATAKFGLAQFRNITLQYNALVGYEILMPVAEVVFERTDDDTIPDDVGALMWPDGTESKQPPKEFNQCHPGTYVADDGTCEDCPEGSVSDGYDTAECSKCELGTYSNENLTMCLNCTAGTIAAERGLSACTACPVGQYMDSEMGSSCTLCAKGTYATSTGSTACAECTSPLSTADVGSSSHDSCICPSGTYSDGNDNCVTCGEGLSCVAGAALANLPTSSADSESAIANFDDYPYPEVEAGYYTTYSDPLSVYLCLESEYCPGGLPETCADNSVGIGCGNCIEGYYRDSSGSCDSCTSVMRTRGLLISIPTIMIPVIYILSLDTSDITTWYRAKNMVPCLVYIALFFVQALAMYSIFSIEMPENTQSFSNSISFSLDFRTLLRPECAEFYDYSSNFAAGLATPFYFAAVVLFTWLISIVLSRYRSEMGIRWCCALSFFGACYSTFYVSIANLTLNLFACYDHPNGKWSLRSASHELCYEGDWNALVGVGVVGIFIYCILALAIMVYAIWRAPRYYTYLTYRLATKFLFVRFRMGYAWWSTLLLLKGLLVSMTPVLFTDGVSQFMWINVVFTAYVPLAACLLPWRSYPVAVLDIFSHMVLSYAFGLGGFFTATTDDEKADVSHWLFACVGCVGAGVAVCACHIAFTKYKQDYKDETFMSNREELSHQIVMEMTRLVDSPEMLTYLLKVLPDAEIRTFRAIQSIISREAAQSMSVSCGLDPLKPSSLSSPSASPATSEIQEEKASTLRTAFEAKSPRSETAFSLGSAGVAASRLKEAHQESKSSTTTFPSGLEVSHMERPWCVYV